MPIVVPTPNTVITSAWGKSVADMLNANIPRELAYTQATTTKSVTSGVETSADLVVAAPAIALDGTTAVLVELFAPAVIPASVAGAFVMVWLYQDGLSIGRMATVITPAAGQLVAPVYAARRLTPAAGNRQFSFAATAGGGGAGSVVAAAGGVGQYQPAFIRVTRAA